MLHPLKLWNGVSVCARGAALVLVAGGCVPLTAAAQELTKNDSGWALIGGPGKPAPYYLHTQAGSGGLPANAPTEFHKIQTGSVVRAGVSAAAQRTGAPSDEATYSIRYERSFILNENADIWLPTFLSAQLTKAGTPPNSIAARSTARVEVFKQGAGNAWIATGIFAELQLSDQAGNSTWTLKDGVKLGGGALTADATKKYMVRAEVTSSVTSIAAGAGSSATVDSKAYNAGREGMAASFALTPSGLTYDSRKGVKVDAARRYGLTGKGIKIGIIEPGNPYTGDLQHVDLAGQTSNSNGGVAGQHMDEHATAVAGILVSKNASLEKQGVAPGAKVVSAGLSSYESNVNVWSNLLDAGATVINMSAGTDLGQRPDDWLQRWRIDNGLNARPEVTFVVSAGNDGPPRQGGSTVSDQGGLLNGISVGSLNRDGKALSHFSSFSSGSQQKPDIVAPGEYILSTAVRDADGVAGNNDYRRIFMGGDFDRKDGWSTSGAVNGTSFSAPLVAGAAALMQEYAKMAPRTHDARASDSRVIKAILLNSASTKIVDGADKAWQQYQDVVKIGDKDTRRVWRSLNASLGAGALDIEQAMYTYATPEARQADDAAGRNVSIDLATNNGKLARDRYWDLQRINRPVAEANGWATVDYLLGTITGPTALRTTLTWQTQAMLVNNTVVERTPKLNLYLYQEGTQDGNAPGWDPTKPTDDLLIAFTQEDTGTVRLIDMLLNLNGKYYLEVRSEMILSDQFFTPDFDFGIAITVPGPGCLGLLTIGVLAAGRRRWS